jgi:hypothetical protein
MFNNEVISRTVPEPLEDPPTPGPERIDEGFSSGKFAGGTTSNGTEIGFHCASSMSGNIDISTKALQEKHARVKKAIFAVMPPYQELMKTIQANQEWWYSFRFKCP